MKKSIFTAVLVCLFFSNTNAQFLQLGAKAGISFSNFGGGDIEGVDFKTLTNYHFGVVAELKLLDNLALQPELLYSTQGAELDGLGVQFKNELGYIALPVLIKFYLTDNKLSLEAGPQLSFLVSEKNDVNFDDSETFDFGFAAGLSYKLTNNIFVSGRYIAGLTEVKKDSDIKNSVIQFSVGIFL